MSEFEYVRATSLEEAARLLEGRPEAQLLAGGTDLLPLIKAEIVSPRLLVDVAAAPASEERAIEVRPDGLRIGALASLEEIARHEEVRRSYGALADACGLAASSQLRHMGTIGGNLLQQTRCWYYRGPYRCWLKGGDTCFARTGENEHHSIFMTAPGESPCVSAHPSDPAAALLALAAGVVVRTGGREERIPAERFFALPAPDRRNFVSIGDGAIVQEVTVPAPPPSARSTYVKAMERAAWSFPLAGVAAYVEQQDGAIQTARFALSGVAPIPLRARAVEEQVTGRDAKALDASELAGLLVEEARPLGQNRFKVPLLRGLFIEALEKALS